MGEGVAFVALEKAKPDNVSLQNQETRQIKKGGERRRERREGGREGEGVSWFSSPSRKQQRFPPQAFDTEGVESARAC